MHHAAAGLLALATIQYAISGGASAFLLRHARLNTSGELQEHNPNAILALALVAALWVSAISLLIVPGVAPEVELGLGFLMIFGSIAAVAHRRAMNIRSFLLVAAGTLILVDYVT